MNVHHLYARHPNRLWTIRVTGPNQIWVGDITYLTVGGVWRYLAIVMDLFSRRILAWSLTRHRTAAVTCAVLVQAARHRAARGVIFHSDRGSEYMGAPFCAQVTQLGLLQSASGAPATTRTPSHSFTLLRPNSPAESRFQPIERYIARYAATSTTTTRRAFTQASTTSRHLHLNRERRKPRVSTKAMQDPERSL